MLKALKVYLVLALLTGVIYPLFITLIAHLLAPELSRGSFLTINKQKKGSFLIGQPFSSDHYFWSRPSAIDYMPLTPSGGSNLGPTSKQLQEIVIKRLTKYPDHKVPKDLIYASGSGLDPHISLKAALYQMPRVAKSRNIEDNQLKSLILDHEEGMQLGFIGKRYVNVLRLNLALDSKFPLEDHGRRK